LINAEFDQRAIPMNKIKGLPFTAREIGERAKEMLVK